MSFADFFDLGFFRAREVFEEVKESVGFTGDESFADEGGEVFAVADSGREEKLVLFVAVRGLLGVSRRNSPACFGGLHQKRWAEM